MYEFREIPRPCEHPPALLYSEPMGADTGGKLGIHSLSDGGVSRSGATPLVGAGFPLFSAICTLTVFVCSAFAAAAGVALIVLYMKGDFNEGPGFFMRLSIKTLFFIGATAVSGLILTKYLPSFPAPSSIELNPPRFTTSSLATLLLAFGLSGVLVLPNLGAYPWPAPDETHHLIVARNLAEYGAYASGHPDDSLTYFDIYDSVGAPVIVPVAAAFKVLGIGLTSARIVIALSYLVLCALVFFLVRRPFGDTAAAAGVLMMTMAFGSVYLARSLYGEVPALMFFMAGLLCWGRGLDSEKSAALPLIAGAFFGLAVLSKAFMFIAALAFAAAWLYDRLTYRRIATKHVILPFVGLCATLGAWMAVEFAYRHLTSDEGSTLLYYRHSLMFGLNSLPSLAPQLYAQSIPLLISLLAFVFVAPRIFRDRYDPPLMVLFLLATLFAFWWVFFTPGRIPRYMWYSCAITGIFSGPLLCSLLGRLSRPRLSRPRWRGISTAAALAAAAIVIAAGALRTGPQLQLALFDDRTHAERELAQYIRSLPPDTRVATTYWPAQRSVNFLANRHIDLVSADSEEFNEYETIVFSRRMPPVPPEAEARGRSIGHYVVLTTHDDGEAQDAE